VRALSQAARPHPDFLPQAGEGDQIRVRAGPSSNALAVNRIEICFDAR